MLLGKDYEKYIEPVNSTPNYYVSQVVDSCKVYLHKIDSFKRLSIAEDSLFYFSALALHTICNTYWYCHQGCGGCSYALVDKELERFMQKFPNSQLLDNAAYYINFGNSYFYEEYDVETINIRIKEYENFLRKYPDGDTRADVMFDVFLGLSFTYEIDSKRVKKAAKQFISEFSNDKRVPYVRERLLELDITL